MVFVQEPTSSKQSSSLSAVEDVVLEEVEMRGLQATRFASPLLEAPNALV